MQRQFLEFKSEDCFPTVKKQTGRFFETHLSYHELFQFLDLHVISFATLLLYVTHLLNIDGSRNFFFLGWKEI